MPEESLLNKNILDKNVFDNVGINVSFSNNIKSTKIEEELFTNFIDNRKSPMIKFLKNERRKILEGRVDYDNDFEIKYIENKGDVERIKRILNKTIDVKNINLALLCRLKTRINPEVQFYFFDDKNGNYKIILIDIYHLLLLAKAIKEKKPNPEKKYEAHKNAHYCLSNIYAN